MSCAGSGTRRCAAAEHRWLTRCRRGLRAPPRPFATEGEAAPCWNRSGTAGASVRARRRSHHRRCCGPRRNGRRRRWLQQSRISRAESDILTKYSGDPKPSAKSGPSIRLTPVAVRVLKVRPDVHRRRPNRTNHLAATPANHGMARATVLLRLPIRPMFPGVVRHRHAEALHVAPDRRPHVAAQ